MKKIWIINHYATPPMYGGLTRHHFLAKNVDKKKYDVTLVASSAIHNSDINFIEKDCKNLYIENIIDNVKYFHIKTSQYKGNKIKRIINMLQFYFRAYKVCKKKIKKGDIPDYIYTSMPHPLSPLLSLRLAKKFKIPCTVEIRDLWPETIISFGMIKKNGLIAKLLFLLEKYIYINASKLVFTMEGGKDYLKERKYISKIDLDKVYHLNNGADLKKIENDLKEYSFQDLDLDNKNTFKIVYTGSIRYAYNIDKIVKIAKKFQDNKIKNVKFLIYGNGPYKDELVEFCKKEKINNIVFKGFVDAKYIPYILSKCNLGLLHGANHSVFKYGTSQNKMFTYLSSGKPIVSTFPNKYDLITKNKCGETIQNDSIEEYYEKILKIYNLPEEQYKKYCENSRKLSKKYDYAVLSKKMIDIIINN